MKDLLLRIQKFMVWIRMNHTYSDETTFLEIQELASQFDAEIELELEEGEES